MKTNPETIILENYNKKESAFFSVDPIVIVFKNFEPNEDYCATLIIQNISPVLFFNINFISFFP